MAQKRTDSPASAPVWARAREIERITGAPQKWLETFARDHKKSVRKFGNGNRNGTLVYKVADVLDAIEAMGKEVRHA